MTVAEAGILTVEAPAKINLYLHVVGRRADGYHELDSLIAFTDVFDLLTLRPANDLSLTAEGIFADRLPESGDNLILRAARALAEAAGIPAQAAITLRKDLPVGAGLGSGSADAAATLRGLATLWSVDTDKVDLKEVGFSLGTDIPACLISDTVHVSGVGEILEPGPALPDAGILLVNPGISLATPSVFKARRGGFSPEDRMTETPKSVAHLVTLLEERSNDLTEPAVRIAPVVREVVAALEAATGCRLARMSGSGATCFGLFDNPAAAEAAAATIDEEGWWVRATRFRSRSVR